ncbi:MAG TPA: rhomboid family intramembrane serine protease [Chloroflexia bacterium]|nr:rhomboid family intramembrane serine protease [Chloroflexia bacterium]
MYTPSPSSPEPSPAGDADSRTGRTPGYPPSSYSPIPVYPPYPPPVDPASFSPPEYGVERAYPSRVWLRIPLEKPFLTQAILITLVAIYVPMFLSEQTYETVFNWGAKSNPHIYAGEWYRLISATFLHAQTPVHLFFNGYALYMIGMDLEAFAGRWRFAVIYFVSGLGGSVASLAFSPYPGVGASGAIFGLIGALGVYFGLHRRLFGRMGQAQFWNIIVVIVLNVGLGFSGIFPIDNSAHIGGLVTGAALGYVLCPRYALGAWRLPNIRDIENTNRSVLVWVATALIALDVIFAFFVVLLLARKGIYLPRL